MKVNILFGNNDREAVKKKAKAVLLEVNKILALKENHFKDMKKLYEEANRTREISLLYKYLFENMQDDVLEWYLEKKHQEELVKHGEFSRYIYGRSLGE